MEDPSKYEVFRFYEVNKKGNNDEDDDWKIENMPFGRGRQTTEKKNQQFIMEAF